MRGGVPYPFAKSKHNGMRTYGLHYHFGGWNCFARRRTVKHAFRRQWRKQARREAKRWLQQEAHDSHGYHNNNEAHLHRPH